MSKLVLSLSIIGLILMQVVLYTSAQMYHYSKGWGPSSSGKRNSPENLCQVRPFIRKLVHDVIQGEFERLKTVCAHGQWLGGAGTTQSLWEQIERRLPQDEPSLE
ncbi:prepro-gonadotropin-releasing hormone-like protein [Lingula anatina]|uniref:Prepro-gonadotropin-releasing hormone-like protein n=1 Tax=Lingula anatina TaxID=7574 RepID=A0A1S3HFE7_LINAN|nr:prepro-gonadotropin-releasing hormone-like protein [Lingula anatina]|eukprot:XP_013384764.1 prepro-gonadotropin-releasing hormone-like protein [Lingula anatina]